MKTMKKAAFINLSPISLVMACPRAKRIALALLMAAAQSACINLEPVSGHALSTRADQRFTDEAINRDLAAIKDLLSRAEKLIPNAASVYAIVRAQAMIEFGSKEYDENDKTGILEPVLDDALRLLLSQKQGKAVVDFRLPELPGLSPVRADIWNKIANIKQDEGLLQCVGEPLARLEIGLLELAHEQYEVDSGLNSAEHSLPYISRIDGLQATLDAALTDCRNGLR